MTDECPIDHNSIPKKSTRAHGTFDRGEDLTIEFVTQYDDAYDIMRPVPMSKAQPEWWKNLGMYVHEDKFTRQQTGKGCPSLHDLMNTGYIVRTHKTVLVIQIPDPEYQMQPYDENPDFLCAWCDETCDPESEIGKLHRERHNHAQGGTAYVLKDEHVEDMREWLNKQEDRRQIHFDLLDERHESKRWIDWRYEITGGHNGGQVMGSDYDKRYSVKFRQPWTIRTPEGTSCYWFDPFLTLNRKWTVLTGVIDTDGFNQLDTNCITIIHPLTDENFIIPKGTPLVHIVPFVRTKWKSEYVHDQDIKQSQFDDDVIKKMGRKAEDGEGELNLYRRHFWERKEFK